MAGFWRWRALKATAAGHLAETFRNNQLALPEVTGNNCRLRAAIIFYLSSWNYEFNYVCFIIVRHPSLLLLRVVCCRRLRALISSGRCCVMA